MFTSNKYKLAKIRNLYKFFFLIIFITLFTTLSFNIKYFNIEKSLAASSIILAQGVPLPTNVSSVCGGSQYCIPSPGIPVTSSPLSSVTAQNQTATSSPVITKEPCTRSTNQTRSIRSRHNLHHKHGGNGGVSTSIQQLINMLIQLLNQIIAILGGKPIIINPTPSGTPNPSGISKPSGTITNPSTAPVNPCPPSTAPTQPVVNPTKPVNNPSGGVTNPTVPVTTAPTKPSVTPGSWWKPMASPSLSWDWVIGTTPKTPYRSVNVYDIDGFDNPASTITAMHTQGIKVICYIDVGTYETGRPDLDLIPAADKGSAVQGWAGEYWLNIADISGLTPLINERMQMCKTKGFDAIEPDNIDGYTNSTGFPLTSANQLAYNEFLANTAHSLGLSIGLKNDTDQTAQLQPYFDYMLDEQCNEYNECSTLSPFTQANKAVFNAEYSGGTGFCAADAAAHINGVLFALNLDDSVYQPCTQTW